MELFVNALVITAAVVVGFTVTPKVIKALGSVARLPGQILVARKRERLNALLAEQRAQAASNLREQAYEVIDSDTAVSDLVKTLSSVPHNPFPRTEAGKEQNRLRKKALAELRAVVSNEQLRKEIIQVSRETCSWG
tara:strand:+ start:369 stop:776 length:408 start_codon:yes stop_codon:yes gene_type:complete